MAEHQANSVEESAARAGGARSDGVRRLLVGLTLVLLAAMMLSPAWWNNTFPRTHEDARFAMLLGLFVDALSHGNVYPRWLPMLAGGYGYPTFVFYQPGSFYVAALCLLVVGSQKLATAWLVALGVMSLVGVSGAYGLTKVCLRMAVRWDGLGRIEDPRNPRNPRSPRNPRATGPGLNEAMERRAELPGALPGALPGTLPGGGPGRNGVVVVCGLFGAAMFALTPYAYVNLYVRGAFSEYASMMLLPWAALFVLKLVESVRDKQPATGACVGMVLSWSALIYCHPATSLVFFVVGAWLGLVLMVTELHDRASRQRFVGLAMVSGLAALALSSPYWYSVASMGAFVKLDHATTGYFASSRHMVYPHQLISRFWGFGTSEPGWQKDGMSMALGLPHALLALAGVVAGFAGVMGVKRNFRGGRRGALVVAAALAYGVLILLMLPWAAGLWSGIKLLELIQFPWRLLSITATLQVMCMAGLLSWWVARATANLGATPVPVGEGPRAIGPGLNGGVTRVAPLLLLLAVVLTASAIWYWPMFSIAPGSTKVTLAKVDALLWSRLATVRDRDYTYTSGDEFRPITCLYPLQLTRRGDVSLIDPPEAPSPKALSPEAPPLPPEAHPPEAHPPELARTPAPSRITATPLPDHTPYRLAFTIDATEPTLLPIHQMYLPGWVVSIDGKDVSRETLESWLATDGRMRVWVPKGRCELRATYDGPIGWRVRNGIIIAVLTGAVGVMIADRRRGSRV
jgi:hypothetical protein